MPCGCGRHERALQPHDQGLPADVEYRQIVSELRSDPRLGERSEDRAYGEGDDGRKLADIPHSRYACRGVTQ